MNNRTGNGTTKADLVLVRVEGVASKVDDVSQTVCRIDKILRGTPDTPGLVTKVNSLEEYREQDRQTRDRHSKLLVAILVAVIPFLLANVGSLAYTIFGETNDTNTSIRSVPDESHRRLPDGVLSRQGSGGRTSPRESPSLP